MKVGIVTIFDNENLGNRLQNYALQTALSSYADTVRTIKNKPRYANNALQNLRRSNPLAESVLANRLLGKTRKVEMLRFNGSYVKASRKCYWCNVADTEIKPADRCDFYCAGSDQIWNPEIGRGTSFDFLDFADREKTFSYAASFGVDQIGEKYRQMVRKGLEHMRYISVREDAGKQIVEELTGRTDAQVLIDPTMLLTAQDWEKVAEKPKAPVPERYLLTYFLGEVSPERKAAIQARAKELDCQVIDLMDSSGPFHKIGPDAFVYLISHAQYVCTDSFHGSVFTFLHSRPLAIMTREGKGGDMNSRLETLVEKFSLQGCVACGNKLPDLQETDYSAGFAALEEERKKSKAFLDMVFQGAEGTELCE